MEERNYKYDYFISYRRACGGALSARHVKTILCKYGKKVFLDVDDIKKGEYEPQIYSAIENSKEFILILNEESWREKENIDVYYEEIIRITQQSGDIIPIEFAKDVLKNIPDFLKGQLNKVIKDYEKVIYSHDAFFHFEEKLCDKLGISYIYDSKSEKLPHFSMPFKIEESDLIKRDEKVDELCNEIASHHIFNLVGIGGIGKTTLSYLLAERYKNLFSNIAYVVVNGNIKEDFVSQINETLDEELNLAPNLSADEKYKEIISFMDDNYKTGNNLLILDVNETSDRNFNKEFAEGLVKFPDNWRVFILSRENFGSFNYKNINDEDDKEFLKKLFLSKAGAKYKDITFFDQLFKLIWYNSLLAEQLGYYLKFLPVQTYDEIKNILCKDILDENIEGINAQDRKKTLTEFLKNLIKIQDFDEEQQKLLRHFVLWESEFIGYNIICDLLKGVCVNINKTLVSLSKRSILSFDETKSAYKLHGLLADSLLEQIDVTKQDYTIYFDNIIRILRYNFREFLPYADCIGNSLCEYKITTWVGFLNNTASKFDDTWKTDYAKKLYDKCIEISNQRLETDPENIEYLEDLSYAYGNLANLQQDRLNDYESAEKNYNEAIEIDKRIIKISATPKYQNLLATHYNNLAALQDEHLNDPKSAETNYKKAIEILEKITENSDNPEYLNGLARTYYNLAMLQQVSLNDYDSAEIHYNKAIEIGEEIRKVSDNPKYLNLLSKAYGSLAVLQKDQKRYESAIKNCKNATEIYAIVKDTNLEYLVDWMLAKDILADLYIATDNPTEARVILDEIKPQAEELLEEYPDYGFLKQVYVWIMLTELKLNP